jgi:hypothetical protein
MDSGIILWRQNALSLLGLSLLMNSSPRSPFKGHAPKTLWIFWLIVWLLKPLAGRLFLKVLSERYIDSSRPFRLLFKGLHKQLFNGLVGDLTWRRFSGLRAAILPARMLERLKGKALGSRSRFLKEANSLKTPFSHRVLLSPLCPFAWGALFLYEHALYRTT